MYCKYLNKCNFKIYIFLQKLQYLFEKWFHNIKNTFCLPSLSDLSSYLHISIKYDNYFWVIY